MNPFSNRHQSEKAARRAARRRTHAEGRKRWTFRPSVLLLENRLAPAIVVNTFTDETFTEPGPQLISLREAVTAVNLGLVSDNTIMFAHPGVYKLTMGEALDVTHTLHLVGNTTGTGTTIDSLFLDRQWELEGGATTVTMSGVTIRNGLATVDEPNGGPPTSGANGGGIEVRSPGDSLALTNVKILNCKAVGSTTASNNGNNEGNGGALFTAGSVSLVGCTLSFNKTTENTFDGTGGNGGAIFANGKVSLDSTTISNNTTDTVNFVGSGGGVFALGAVTLTNGTVVTKNTAEISGGGIFDPSSTVSLTNSHVDNNTAVFGIGGGIACLKSVTLTGTGTLTSSANKNTAAGAGGGIFSDAKVTLTKSSASGNTSGGPGGGIDSALASVSLTGSTASGNKAGAAGGITALVNVSLTSSHVDGNTATVGAVGGLAVGIGSVTLTAGSSVSGNTATTFAGGILGSLGDITVTDSHVDNNVAGTFGGGIISATAISTITVTRGTVSGNTAGSFAGGIFTVGGDVNIIGTSNTALSHVDNNTATTGAGGGIDAPFGAKVTVTLATVSGNSAGTAGGGMNITGGAADLTMSMSTVDGNVAATSGGGIVLTAFTNSSISQSTITNNTANGGVGGGIEAISGVAGALLSITNSTIGQNFAATDGGGLYSDLTNPGTGQEVSLLYCTFNFNDASGAGGFDGKTGGSVFVAAGDVQAEDSIFANSTPHAIDVAAGGATFTTAGHNLSDDAFAFNFLVAGFDFFQTDVHLGPLTTRGTCPNKVYIPLAGSTAIGNGDGAAPLVDECNVPREAVGDDIGAVEVGEGVFPHEGS